MKDDSKTQTSLNYYIGALRDAIDQNNNKSSLYFLVRIVEILNVKIENDRILMAIGLVITIINLFLFVTTLYTVIFHK